MDDYHAELAEINLCCERLDIGHGLLNVADVAAPTGWSRKTVKKHIRFGVTSRHRVISRSQLARQIADLAMYQPE